MGTVRARGSPARGPLLGRTAGGVAVLLLAACGSGALGGLGAEDPDGSAPVSGASDVAAAEAEGGGDDGDVYGWGLPTGPVAVPAVQSAEAGVYRLLARGECASAQARLDADWELLGSPRTVLLYQAAVDVCAGRTAAAQRWFSEAAAYGWSGLDRSTGVGFRFDCEVYRSVRSVLEQRPRDEVTCPGGTPPTWPHRDPAVPRDDPRTRVDESATGPDEDDATARPSVDATSRRATTDPGNATPDGGTRTSDGDTRTPDGGDRTPDGGDRTPDGGGRSTARTPSADASAR